MTSSTSRISAESKLLEQQSLQDTLSQVSNESSVSQTSGSKERRNPSVTPRKFRRFFTPRATNPRQASSARRALNELNAPSLNRDGTQSSPLRAPKSINGQENPPTIFPRALKRRKMGHVHASVDKNEFPGKKVQDFSPFEETEDGNEAGDVRSSPCNRNRLEVDPLDTAEDDEEEPDLPSPPRHITPVVSRGLAGQLLSLSIGSRRHPGRQSYAYPVHDYQDETSRFYSGPQDVHTNMNTSDRRCIPFCTTACNTNSLVAIGDEEGRVKLLETAEGESPPFSDYALAFRVHSNAIIDMNFSNDDRHLATASGDQSARVVDMHTQTTIAVLGYHTASLKQVRFQPGRNNNSILATSSRDGIVQIWDLRCRGDDGPMHQMYLPISNGVPASTASQKVNFGRPVNTINFAHRSWNYRWEGVSPTDTPAHGETAGRLGDVSVTAIQFLPVGQEHLLLSASEADASVRLWDIRCLQGKNKNSQTPLAISTQPESHSQWRKFGITSLNLNGDGSRLYTLCKDNTVYVYSVAHLMLGSAPELATNTQTRPGPQRTTQEGLGPLYGYRHPNLHATSFYVKAAIRKAEHGRCEMLAVGSSDACAVLFPTDERYLPRPEYRESGDASGSSETVPVYRRSLRTSSSRLWSSKRVEETIPISTNGSALVRGHDREVGSLTWSHDGSLVTISDDYLVRCWREEGDKARDLRLGGENEGRRWGHGWGEMDAKFMCDEIDELVE